MERWVLTGGPCAGKSTVLMALEQRFPGKLQLVPEVATLLFEEGHPQPGRDCEWSAEWQRDFQIAVNMRQQYQEAQALEQAALKGVKIIICDRGILDGAAYTPGGVAAFLQEHHLSLEEVLGRYKRVLHLESVATCRPELFGTSNNACRYESDIAEAVERELATRQAWQGHSCWRFIPGAQGIEAVTQEVLRLVEDRLYHP